MMIVAAAVLVIGALVFTLLVRAQDLPEPEPVSPIKHLEERKATIYDNLRDLQFEYRVGKLSDKDYQQTKQDLQKELAAVLAEIDAAAGQPAPTPKPSRAAPPTRARKPAVSGAVCPHCGAKFANAMKFCGECGKPIPVEASK
jgi:cytochrome c-type biogenesis protein CcmI